jgi:hypothetical protein
MTIADFQTMAASMAQSLLTSQALADRHPDSPPWTVSIDKVTNLSSDVMTQEEQWAIVAMLRGAAPMQALWDEKNVRFVLPPEQVLALRHDPDAAEFHHNFAQDRHPTHTMAATFFSVTRATATQRTELYYCEFEILDLARHQSVWIDKFEYKRLAQGHLWD